MAAPFPYTHYACPCSDLTTNPVSTTSSKRASIILPTTTIQLDEDRSFNPHDPRANFTLYPLDRLLYCDECDAIRCPRCWTEEVLYWYCPSCLFDVPSSAVRGDGNRCSRSCYNCPSCTAPLGIVALPQPDDGFLKPGESTAGNHGESYILQCQCCQWSSLDIDVQFAKATKMTEQIAKLRRERLASGRKKNGLFEKGEGEGEEEESKMEFGLDHDTAFVNLTTFYKDQLNDTGEPQNPFSNSPYNSPANLARIMSLYGGTSYNALKKTREKPQPMREAVRQSEGLMAYTLEDDNDESKVIHQLETNGWECIASQEQQYATPMNMDAKFNDDLWPVATPLRTKRGKRCRTCRQFLARPEPKVNSMRYRIRLLALNFLPRLSMKTLHGAVVSSNPAFRLRPGTPEETLLKPLEPRQYILTARNPIFESIHITLATPTVTPGRIASRVTILCPSFTVGAAGDVWDEVLSASQPPSADGGRKAAMASLTGSADGDRQPEAGKVWERTRDTTSVIVEIVPGSLPVREDDKGESISTEQDEDVLEVPVYVRTEWEAEVKEGETSMGKKEVDHRPGEKVKKELGYWVVLGVGRIAD